MGMRLRVGPVSVSSRGRVGVRAGPVSVYGGGRRRSSRSSNDGWAYLILLVLVVAAIGLAIKYWYVTAPVLVLLCIGAVMVAQRNKERKAAEAVAAQEALERWLAGPPPVLEVPGRFTQNWFAAHVPALHPGQVPALYAELHQRGWTSERIEQRVVPFLAQNPFYTEA